MPENSGGREGRSNVPADGQRRTYRRRPRGNAQPNQDFNNPDFLMSNNYHGNRYGNQGYAYNGPNGMRNGNSAHSRHVHATSYHQYYRHQTQSGHHRRDRDNGRQRNEQEHNVSSVHDLNSQVERVTISPAVENQATSLRHQIESNSYECMVCYDTINAFCATYSCFQCYNIFHLSCIRQWASAKLSDDTRPEGTVANWTCPACQVSSTALPFRYLCFCQSVINPKFKPFVLPHSCGEKCSRVRGNCSHACPEPCHPGKCPPCPAFVLSYCLCHSESKRVKCSQKDVQFKCVKVCGKSLNCSKHFCQNICHLGDCDICPETNELVCYCGKSNKSIPCGSESENIKSQHTGYWSCYERCLQPLSCKNHNCSRTCHPDDCMACENDVNTVMFCPCGKTKLDKLSNIKRRSCLDVIPTCKKACKKPLICGTGDNKHICQAICHNGPCPPCSDRSLVMCSCQSSTESMLCSDIPKGGLKCERVCYKKKSCGRHRCNAKCCLEDNHVCMIPCGKLLSCKIHKCEELCHRGHCMPCLLSNFREVYCTCGRTKLDPPVACGTPPPNCNEICNRQHSCDHVVTHACHYDEHCPPCAYLVNKVCMGGHAVRFNIPCHVTGVSCGEICRKPLPCTMHMCERWCHSDDCVSPQSTCELPCIIKRTECSHNCNAKCHVGKYCPQSVCFEKIKALCGCRRRSIDLLCFKGATKLDENPDLGRYNSKLRSFGLSVAQQDLVDYLKTSRVQCVEKCHVEERNQKLAEGLGLTNVPIDGIIAPTYSEYLKLEVKNNKEFIVEIEDQFAELIAKFKRRNETADMLNKVNYVHYDFKPMKKEKRKTIHELAAFYKISTQSVDDEPLRNVQIKIAYNSAIPTVKLSQFFQKRVIGGVGTMSKVAQKNEPGTDSKPKMQTLDHNILQNEDIVFDSWEDINEN